MALVTLALHQKHIKISNSSASPPLRGGGDLVGRLRVGKEGHGMSVLSGMRGVDG